MRAMVRDSGLVTSSLPLQAWGTVENELETGEMFLWLWDRKLSGRGEALKVRKTPREHCFTRVSICSSRGAVRGSPRLPHLLQHAALSCSPQEAGFSTSWCQSKFFLPSLFDPLKSCLSSANCGRRGLWNLANHEIYEKWNFSQKTDGNNF